MYLSLPLPSTTMRTMTLTVVSTDGTTLPAVHNVVVPNSGRLTDLIGSLSTQCSLRDNETLLVAEVCCCVFSDITVLHIISGLAYMFMFFFVGVGTLSYLRLRCGA